MNPQTLKKCTLALAISSSLLLAACSNSSGSSGPADENTATGQSVSGSAVKGVLKNAVVVAFELNANGSRMTDSVGTTRTDNNGEYSLPLSDSYGGGVLEVVIRADAQTRMTCDAERCGDTEFGDDVSLPATFELTRLSQPEPGAATVSAPVSAWTTLASNRAKTLLSSNPGEGLELALAKANRSVSDLVGYDVEKVQPKGLSQLGADSNADDVQSAVLNAVIADFIYQSGQDFGAAFNDFAGSLSDGRVDDDDNFNVGELVERTRAVIARNPIQNAEAADRINQSLEFLEVAGNFDAGKVEAGVQDPDATLADKIDAFKDFLSRVRSFGVALDDLAAEGTLENAIGADEDTLTAIFDEDTVGAIMLSAEIVGQALNAVIDDPEVETITLTNPDDPMQQVGEATLTVTEGDDGESFELALVGEATGQTTFAPFELTLAAPVPFSLLTDDNAELTALAESNDITLNGQMGDENSFIVALNDINLNLELSESLTASAGDALTDEQVFNVAVSGELSGGLEISKDDVGFSGSILARLVRFDNGVNTFFRGDDPVSIEALRLSGRFEGDAIEAFTASASLNIRNARQYDTFGWLDLNGSTQTEGAVLTNVPDALFTPFASALSSPTFFADLVFDDNEIVRALVDDGTNSQPVMLNAAASAAAFALVDNVVSARYNTDVLNYEVESGQINFNQDRNGSVFADIEFTNLENAESFIDASFSLSTGIETDPFTGRVVATLSRNTLLGGSVSLRLISDATTGSVFDQDLKIEVASANVEAGMASVVFSSPAGFRLNAALSLDEDGDLAELTGDAFVGDDDIGDLQLRNGVPFLVYAENNGEVNFESLF